MKTLARQRDKAEILRRLRELHPQSGRRWGRMSAHQMVCHLNDSFCVMTGERTASASSGPVQCTVMKWLALYLPVKWPPGIQTRPEIDQEIGGTRPHDFAADVARLESLLELITTSTRRFDAYKHPVFGRMSHAAWLRWGYLHTDHHFRQFGA